MGRAVFVDIDEMREAIKKCLKELEKWRDAIGENEVPDFFTRCVVEELGL